jgi:hypothetical protein
MPMAAMMVKLQGALTPEAIDDVRQNNPALIQELNRPGTLVDVAGSVVDLAQQERQYLEAIPPVLREGIRATIAEAINAGKTVHVGYSPGYDFEVRLNDYVEGINVQVSGPYPPTFPRDGYASPASS